MDNRPTRKIKTPSGKEAELKTYLTKGETKQLRDIFMRGMKVEVGENGKPVVKEISGSTMSEAEDKLIELALVSYDGSAEKILERLLDLAADEYDFILAEANKLQTGFQSAK